MKTKLVSYTQPVWDLIEEGVQTPTDLVSFCARVSNPNNQLNVETADRLVRFLIRNKHWSPLEMVDATFEIETTRDISRQILRHCSFRFQEFSQRYSSVTEWEVPEVRLQDTQNRQNSIPVDDIQLAAWWDYKARTVYMTAFQAYQEALEKGVAKEVARKLLPEGMTISRMYMKGSLRSWIHYCQLRSQDNTQNEHQDIAIDIAKVISNLFPLSEEQLTTFEE